VKGVGMMFRRPQSRQPRTARGFTLLEVLAALVIFALAAAVLGGAYLNVLNAYQSMARSVRQQDDLRFARELLLAEPDRRKAEEGGDFRTGDGRRVEWRAEIEPTELPDLFTVRFRCRVEEPPPAKTGEVEEVFRVLRPTWSEAEERDELRAEMRQRIERIAEELAR
jgi:general secretion pathway protein I